LKPDVGSVLDGPRGLFCPSCRKPLGNYIAQSYLSPAGVYRRRVCPWCHTDVETTELVVGVELEVLDIAGLNQLERNHVRALVRLLRAGRKNRARVSRP
jgi:transcriptional regulator NrdR family protein